MAKPGPKPTPKAILKLRGSWRAKNRLDDKTESSRPAMPQYLTGEARKEWKRIIPIFEKMGVLAEIDRTMIALYCSAYAEWREADSLVKSLLVKTVNGNIVQHPALSIRNAAWEKMRKVAAEFGMSPAARVGIAVTTKTKSSKDKSRFFDNKGRSA